MRRTFAQVEAKARDHAIEEACRVLKWHLGQPKIADELWRLMQSGAETTQLMPDYLDRTAGLDAAGKRIWHSSDYDIMLGI